MSGGGDLFGALPDELVNHVLSFLPSREAVKSSVLARRWRHLWRSTPAVRVINPATSGALDLPHQREVLDEFRLFVDNLLLRRDATPLRSFQIEADLVIPYNQYDPDFHGDWLGNVDRHLDLWVSHALSAKCRARSLVVRLKEYYVPWRPQRTVGTFASPHLTRILLDVVHLVGGQLDFSCCPALRSLALVRCHLEADALVSPSLLCLAIVYCHSEIGGYRDPEVPDEMLHTSLSTPMLRFLELSENYDEEQFLESMPWLTEDNIRYTDEYEIYSRLW